MGRFLVCQVDGEAQGRLRLAEFEDGSALAHAAGYIRGMRDAGAGDDDVQVVIVMRHAAVPMTLNDAMWAKYEIGKNEDQGLPDRKVRDAKSVDARRRHERQRPAAPPPDRPHRPRMARRHTDTVCSAAISRCAASRVDRRGDQDSKARVYEEFKANLVPGVILQPTGVYAVLRAQEAGCAFFRST